MNDANPAAAKIDDIVLVAHNIRSTHNIGSILRSADGFGVSTVFCTGYTPFPTLSHDDRLPHIRDKLTKQIHKTALGAEVTVAIEQSPDLTLITARLKAEGYVLIALEQSPKSVLLPNFQPQSNKIALLLGEEVHGTPADILAECSSIIEIPMRGSKESFNVSVATGIALYALDQLRA